MQLITTQVGARSKLARAPNPQFITFCNSHSSPCFKSSHILIAFEPVKRLPPVGAQKLRMGLCTDIAISPTIPEKTGGNGIHVKLFVVVHIYAIPPAYTYTYTYIHTQHTHVHIYTCV